MVKIIGDVNNNKIILTNSLNIIITLVSNRFALINKIFGSLIYEKSMSNLEWNYIIREFRDSIIITEE